MFSVRIEVLNRTAVDVSNPQILFAPIFLAKMFKAISFEYVLHT